VSKKKKPEPPKEIVYCEKCPKVIIDGKECSCKNDKVDTSKGFDISSFKSGFSNDFCGRMG
jgi:hypothetical protein